MKELLENYLVYKADIKALEYKLREIETEEVSVGGSNFDINGDIRPKGYMSSNIENIVIKKADKVKQIQFQIEQLKAKVEMIDAIINTLNSVEKTIIELRFYKKLKLDSISVTVKRDISSIQRIIDKSINKMDAIYENAINKV